MIDETFILAAVVVAALLGGVAYLGISGGRKRQSAKEQTPADRKEPAFRPASAADGEASGANKADGAKSTAAADEPPHPVQRKLPIEFTPPELPQPEESQLPEDICYVIRVYGVDNFPAAELDPLVARLAKFRANFFRFLGYDEAAKKWKQSESDSCRYWILAAALADRGGQMTLEKIKLVEEETRRFAEKRGLYCTFPPIGESLENAKLLDEFCNAVDMLLELRVSCPAALPAARVVETLAMHRLAADGNGKYVYRRDSELLFTAAYSPLAGEGMQTVTFSLDAPRVTSPERAFSEMIQCVRRLAEIWGGGVTDPRGEAVDEERIDEIRRQLTILRKQMNDYGVPPGGAIAHILFA